MRLIRMSERSVYHGLSCLHCHKRVAVGRACLTSTFYVTPGRPWVRTQSLQHTLDQWGMEPDGEEMQLRVVYHRACIEKILKRGPDDPAIDVAAFDEYRAALLERTAGRNA